MANKSFSVLKTNCGTEVQDTSTSFATILGVFINRRYFQILRATNWKNIKPDYSFPTVASTQNYALPDDFGKEIACTDVTNKLSLTKCDLEELYRSYAEALTTTGSVERYVIYDDVVKAQPTATSKLNIVSSSASDTAITVHIKGISSSVEVYESVTLTGTTAVDSANSYTSIKSISKSAASVGYVTVTSNSATVTNALIPRETLETRYKLIKLHYVPSTVATISLPYIMKPTPLSQDYDYPLLDIADLIELGSIADAWRYKRQSTKSQQYELLFQQGLQDYMFEMENEPNKITQFAPVTFNQEDLF